MTFMQPDNLQDELFGELGYDPPMEEWYATVALAHDRQIEVAIWWREGKDGPLSPTLERARRIFQLFRTREPEHRKSLATDMLRRYRESARAGVVLPNPDVLAHELTAKQISIATDGTASVHYDDSTELFADHYIMADLDADGLYEGFTLQG